MKVRIMKTILDKNGTKIVEGSKILICESEDSQRVAIVALDCKDILRAYYPDSGIYHEHIDCWNWAITVISDDEYDRLNGKFTKEKLVREKYWELEAKASQWVNDELEKFKKTLELS
jgi:hypothetical protein